MGHFCTLASKQVGIFVWAQICKIALEQNYKPASERFGKIDVEHFCILALKQVGIFVLELIGRICEELCYKPLMVQKRISKLFPFLQLRFCNKHILTRTD